MNILVKVYREKGIKKQGEDEIKWTSGEWMFRRISEAGLRRIDPKIYMLSLQTAVFLLGALGVAVLQTSLTSPNPYENDVINYHSTRKSQSVRVPGVDGSVKPTKQTQTNHISPESSEFF